MSPYTLVGYIFLVLSWTAPHLLFKKDKGKRSTVGIIFASFALLMFIISIFARFEVDLFTFISILLVSLVVGCLILVMMVLVSIFLNEIKDNNEEEEKQ